jgi:hypothetical protein
MRLTTSQLLATLAVGIPAVLFLLAWLATRGAEDGAGAGWLGLMTAAVSMMIFVGFGAAALIFASSDGIMGSLLKGIGLFVAGILCLYFGVISLLWFVSGQLGLFAVAGMFLLPVGGLALYTLADDVWRVTFGRSSDPPQS